MSAPHALTLFRCLDLSLLCSIGRECLYRWSPFPVPDSSLILCSTESESPYSLASFRCPDYSLCTEKRVSAPRPLAFSTVFKCHFLRALQDVSATRLLAFFLCPAEFLIPCSTDRECRARWLSYYPDLTLVCAKQSVSPYSLAGFLSRP